MRSKIITTLFIVVAFPLNVWSEGVPPEKEIMELETRWSAIFAAVSPSGDMAYDYGTAITRTAAGETITGQYLVVWVREDGEWKIAADMFN